MLGQTPRSKHRIRHATGWRVDSGPCNSGTVSRITRVVPDELEGLRLDQALARLIPELSRRTARIALDIGCVFVDKKRVKVSSRKVKAGQILVANLGGAFQRALAPAASAKPISVPILFEDEHVVVVDKPSRLLSAPTPESDRNNVQHWLSQERDPVFVVHRLDLQTSGILIYAKTEQANRALAETFRQHDLVRRYSVFVDGHYPVEHETLTYPVGDRHAITHIELVRHLKESSWLRATLETGRTHQIRLHLLQRGFPVLSDPRYGPQGASRKERQHLPRRLALHAEKLSLAHPVSGRPLDFESPLPQDLTVWLEKQDV